MEPHCAHIYHLSAEASDDDDWTGEEVVLCSILWAERRNAVKYSTILRPHYSLVNLLCKERY